MIKDLFGSKRYKVNLHMHTADSDGRRTQKEALALYREAGYDAVAITDHWVSKLNGEEDGMVLIAGGEYNTTYRDSALGVFHILGIGFSEPPKGIEKDDLPQKIIDAIHAAGGIAVLAHPAWSLNTHQDILNLKGIDATEIYNTVSGKGPNRRPESGLIVDTVASYGCILNLIAADDAHWYGGDAYPNSHDYCTSYIMVKADAGDAKSLTDAIRRGDYYATQGPEIHIAREGDSIKVHTSPVEQIRFYTNAVWDRDVVVYGTDLTEASYPIKEYDRFVRAEATDSEGRVAWSQIIVC